MKVRVLLLAYFAVASGKIVLPNLGGQYVEGQRFLLMADDVGKMHLVDLEADSSGDRSFDAFKDVPLVIFTRNNPTNPDIVTNGDLPQLANSNYDPKKPTKMFIHGWNAHWTMSGAIGLKNIFLDISDVNVVLVDAEKTGSPIYTVSRKRTIEMCGFLATAVDWMVENGASLNDIHIMGHSLGGHASGITSRLVKTGRVGYVTGFDPALPLWSSGSGRLNKNDADYVEVIHTNGKSLGIMEPIGHNDFYPNGGMLQPGCLIVDMACSHGRSFSYFYYSLDHEGFMAKQCDNVQDAEKGNCDGPSLHLGGIRPKPEMGTFYLKTDKKAPYYLG